MHFPWILKLNFILRTDSWNVPLNIRLKQHIQPYPKYELNLNYIFKSCA